MKGNKGGRDCERFGLSPIPTDVFPPEYVSNVRIHGVSLLTISKSPIIGDLEMLPADP
jgi:hypothetical protein